MNPNKAFVQKLLLAIGLILGTMPSIAADSENSKTVGGIVIYVGMLPAELIQGHPAGHAEARMHPEGKAGSRQEHLVVALFDAKTGARITDAEVMASVDQPGVHGPKKRLEPMRIADTITYGNFFDVRSQGTYLIQIEIHRPTVAGVIKAEFKHTPL
jgi:hypothetical protein